MQTHRYQFEWMLLGTALLIVGALVGYWHYADRDRVEALERDRLQVQARVIDENLGRQLEGMNNALAGVRNDYPPSNGKSIGPAASRHLKTLAGAMPGVRTMLVLDAEGSVLASSRDELIGMNFRAREYFKVPREHADPDMLYVARPFKTVLGVFSINVVRVVTGAKGEFAGVVSATLDPEYFNVVLRSVLYAPDMRVSIAHGDGMGFLWMPLNQRAAGIDMARPGSFFTRHRKSGQTATIMTGIVYATGEERMMAVRTIRPAKVPMDKPLVVAVSRDLSAIYAPWRNDALVDSGLYGAIALTAILGLTFTQRRQRTLDRLEADHERERRESAERQELALRASEEKYRGIYDSLQDLYVETDLDGTILEISPQVETLSGGQYKREDILGRSANAFYGDPGRRAAFLRTLTLLGSVKDFESAFLNRDGSVVPCSISAMIRPGADGKPGSIVSTVRDITLRKRAEESLRESEERLRAIFDGALDGILVADAESKKFLTGNPAICRMLGYTLEEIVRIGVSDIHPKQDLPRAMAEFETRQRGESQVVADIPVMRKDGSVFYADIQSAPICLGGRNCLLGHFRDVTARKRADAVLQQSELKYRRLHETMTDAFVLVDMAGHILECNRTYQEMLGYTEAELRQLSYVDFTPGKWHAFEARLVQEQILPQGYSGVYEKEYRRKDGPVFPVELRVSLVRDAAGQPEAMSAIVRDITERKRTEQALHNNAKRLRGLSRRLLTAAETERRNINRELHDRVGQNLAALNINLNIIRSQLPQQSLDAVGARIRDTQTLLEETVAQVRNVMADLHPPALDDFGLLAALHSYVESLGARCAEPITVHGEDLAPRLPLAAETALFRIAQEALANTAKHARARHIQVLLAATPDRVTLTIADDGVGFDAEHAALAHPSWGLATMRGRAEAVGAALRIDTAPGRGTRVVVEIEREAA